MHDKFDAHLRKAILAWRTQRGRQEKLRRIAREEPTAVARDLFVMVGTLSDVWKHLLEKKPSLEAFHYRVLYGLAIKRVQAATKKHEKGSEEQARAMCEAFFQAVDTEPLILDLTRRAEFLPSDAREWYLVTLFGLIGSRISLDRNKRLASVLAEEGAVREELMRQLPGVAFIELAEHKPQSDPYYTALLNRVTSRLEQGGTQAAKLARAGKLVGEEAADALQSEDESVLAEFERQQETLRQLEDQLDVLEQAAGLSPRETQVWTRLRQGIKPAKIAEDLGITQNNVYQVTHNATRKLGEAKKAAGL